MTTLDRDGLVKHWRSEEERLVRAAMSMSAQVNIDDALERADIAKQTADALSTIPEQGVTQKQWLLEQSSKSGSLTWWSLIDTKGEGGYFSTDSTKALRFSRREDAQAFIDDIGWTSVRPMLFLAPSQPAAVAVTDEMVEQIRNAVLSCGHTIVADEITLRRSEGKDGNALNQLSDRIRAALRSTP